GAAALHRHQPRPRRTLRVASGSIEMKIIWRLLLAVAALFVMPVATAWAQGNNAEAKQDPVKEAAREVEREGTIVDGATGAAIAAAIVTAGDKTVRTPPEGHYRAPPRTPPTP